MSKAYLMSREVPIQFQRYGDVFSWINRGVQGCEVMRSDGKCRGMIGMIGVR